MWEFGHYLCTYIQIHPPSRLVHARRWVGFLRLDCNFFWYSTYKYKSFGGNRTITFLEQPPCPQAPRTWGSIEEVVKMLKMLTKKSVGDLNFWAGRPYSPRDLQSAVADPGSRKETPAHGPEGRRARIPHGHMGSDLPWASHSHGLWSSPRFCFYPAQLSAERRSEARGARRPAITGHPLGFDLTRRPFHTQVAGSYQHTSSFFFSWYLVSHSTATAGRGDLRPRCRRR
jgi:hypothetical protein